MARLTSVGMIDVLILAAALLAAVVAVGVSVLRTSTPYRGIRFETLTRR